MSATWAKLSADSLRRLLVEAIDKTQSMRSAAASIPMNFSTFRKYAKQFLIWNPNPSGRGTKRKSPSYTISLDEIVQGKHRGYSSSSLKHRLLKSQLKKNECECCGLSTWQNQPITMQLDHINGDSYDHRLENLRMLCPNCHSQTTTFCGRNIK